MGDELIRLRYDTGVATDKGCVRDHNEDAAISLPHVGIWAVADGMGGHAAGDVASDVIADELGSVGVPVSPDDLRARVAQRLERANARILHIAQSRGGATIGATVAALLITDRGCSCVWAGDSRIYLWRRGRLSRLTTDHSEAQDMIAAGMLTEEQARTWPRRNVITRAIGISERPNTETVSGQVEPDDIFLICSDGLTEHISDAELAQILPQAGAQVTAERLVTLTLERGARDNVTVVVVGCHERTVRD